MNMLRKNSPIIVISFSMIIIFSGCANPSEENADSQKVSLDNTSSVWPNYTKRFNLDTTSTLSTNALALEDEAKNLKNKLKEILPKISITTGQGEDVFTREYFIVEGDIKLDADELYIYCLKRLQKPDTNINITDKKMSNKLTVATDRNGRPAVWPVGASINYYVMRSSFSSKASYDSVVQSMQNATADWMKYCNIKFQYLSNLDRSNIDLESPNYNTIFIVRQFNANGAFIAQSFFPNDPPFKRMLLIDNSFFDSPYNKTGVIRHELGHVLGFRHEHIWSEDEACKGEDIVQGALGAIHQTKYDPYSVMHYPCGLNRDNRLLELTEFDKNGAQKAYPFTL